jgi:hypothetical protein
LKWASPFQSSNAERDRQLSTLVIWGLALTGTPEAAASIRSISEQKQNQFPEGKGKLLEEALKAHEKVTRDGLLEYSKEGD